MEWWNGILEWNGGMEYWNNLRPQNRMSRVWTSSQILWHKFNGSSCLSATKTHSQGGHSYTDIAIPPHNNCQEAQCTSECNTGYAIIHIWACTYEFCKSQQGCLSICVPAWLKETKTTNLIYKLEFFRIEPLSVWTTYKNNNIPDIGWNEVVCNI